jgi:hypothetical protein
MEHYFLGEPHKFRIKNNSNLKHVIKFDSTSFPSSDTILMYNSERITNNEGNNGKKRGEEDI